MRSLTGGSCASPCKNLPKTVAPSPLAPKSKESSSDWPSYDTAEETDVDSRFGASHKSGEFRLASPHRRVGGPPGGAGRVEGP